MDYFGGSWGSSLSLAYSQEYPKNIINIVLRGVFLCREKEIKWFLNGIKIFFLITGIDLALFSLLKKEKTC